MALARTKYGIEYDPGEEEASSFSGAGWAVVALLLAAAAAFSFRVARRIASGDGEESSSGAASATSAPAPARATTRAGGGAPSAPPAVRKGEDFSPSGVPDFDRRPAKVKSLLMRLDAAAQRGDDAMQVAAIEALLALPGDPAADLAGRLAQALGRLNRRILFGSAPTRWTAEIEVRRGDSAERIAREHGCTVSSFLALNAISDPSKLAAGRKVRVLEHPRFNVVARKKSRSVDLFLNGKLFARYAMREPAPPPTLPAGAYATPADIRQFLRRAGIPLAAEDEAELAMLVPRDTPFSATDG